MKQRSKQWLFLLSTGLTCLLACTSALASIEGTRLIGLAMHQDTGRNIYIGALHYDDQIPTPDNLVTAQGPRAMEYRIVARRTSIRSLMGSVLLQAELAAGSPPSANTTAFVGDIMAAVKSSLYAGDSLEIRLNKDNSVTAFLDGLELAQVDDREVADYLIRGWVEQRGPSTAFLSSILAPDIDSSLLPIYEAHTTSEERLAAIQSWDDSKEAPANELAPVTKTSVAATAATASAAAPAVAASTLPAQTSPEAAKSSAQSKKVEELEPDAPAAEPVLLASVSPSREMIQASFDEVSAADVIDAMEYSQRLASFNTQVLKSVYARIRYPKSAIRRNIQGTLELDISVDKAGKLLEIRIVTSSGHSTLDKSAIKAATQAFEDSPMENIDQVAISEYSEDGELLVIPIPVSFILTD